MKLTINSRLVAAVAKFKAISDIRYYLNGVYVEPIPSGGVMIAATNGHALCVWRDINGFVERPAILRTGAKLLAACASKKAQFLQLIDDRLTVTEKLGFEVYVQPRREGWEIEGTFPNLMKVIPSVGDVPNLFDALNPTYVARVNQALSVVLGNSKFGCGVSFNQPEKDRGIVVTCSNPDAQDFLAVIMPLRESVSSQPTWFKTAKAEYTATNEKGGEA